MSLSDEFFALHDEAHQAFDNGRMETSLDLFLMAFRLNPSDPNVLFNVARLLDENDKPYAEDFYLAAITQGSVDAFYSLAFYCNDKNRKADAKHYGGLYLSYCQKLGIDDEYTEFARNLVYGGIRLVSKNISIKSIQKA